MVFEAKAGNESSRGRRRRRQLNGVVGAAKKEEEKMEEAALSGEWKLLMRVEELPLAPREWSRQWRAASASMLAYLLLSLHFATCVGTAWYQLVQAWTSTLVRTDIVNLDIWR